MTAWSRGSRLAAGLAAALALAVGGSAAASAAGGGAPALTLIAEPQAGVAPFLAMIDAARRSVDLTMYEQFDQRVDRALAADARRGVDVRVLLNGGYYSEHEGTNAAAYAYLSAHGVHVRYTPTYFALTHQKTLTVDDSESAIMTLNFDGSYASTRDFAILDRQPADVAAIVATFDADEAGRRIAPSRGTGDLLWSPGAAATVVSLIGSAARSIDLEDEEMDYAPATSALCAAARRGVAVRIVMTADSEWNSAFARLRGCGVSIRLYHGERYYIHAKLLIVDGRRALVSSQNLSRGSLQNNRELGIVLTDRRIVGALARAFDADYANAPGTGADPFRCLTVSCRGLKWL